MYLTDKLKKYAGSGMLPMHMPGHKRNFAKFPWLNAMGCRTDITEISGFDNLNEPEGLFSELNELAAETWGADHTLCMVNGSTGGILASVRAVMEGGGKMLIFRGCHKSVYNATEICGCDTEYIMPPMDESLGIWGSTSPECVENALMRNPDAKLVIITSPTYEGVISDVEGIAEVCHRFNVPLMVDEAHGAHLGFGSFPKSAVSLGADIVVESLHKTLPSLTQTALVHVNGGLVSFPDVQRNAAMFQSSSPSYILSSSIDGCVRYMAEQGEAQANEWLKCLEIVHDTARKLKKLKILCYGDDSKENHGFFSFDPSKLVVLTDKTNIGGAELAAVLRSEYGIEPEMVASDYVIAMTGLGDTEETVGRFCDALLNIDKTLKARKNSFDGREKIEIPQKVMGAGRALKENTVQLPLSESAGFLSAEYVWAYPPGAPVIVPGERINESVIAQIIGLYSSGVSVHSTRKDVPYSIYCVEKSY